MDSQELRSQSGGAAPPPGAGFMNALRWVLLAALAVLALISVASYVAWRIQEGRAVARPAVAKVLYRCPMHPAYTSDHPGECPICGMTLEKVEPGQGAPEAQPGDVPGLAAVTLSPERIQLIGVRTARVVRSQLSGNLDLVGFVTPDESRLSKVQLRVSGWVRELFISRTGEAVSAGQPLLVLYSPELYQSEQEYLIATSGSGGAMGGMHGDATAEATRQRLALMGVPTEELQRLDRERTASTRLTLRSPFSGTVMERDVTEGQAITPDMPLLTLADLSRVWVLADLYEMDFSRAHVGDAATFTLDALPGRRFEGRVDLIYPSVSNETRTLKLRIALSGDGGLLRPGMYGRVRLSAAGAVGLVVPEEAVVKTGEHNYVFLARAGGRFEPRSVVPGVRAGDRVQILSGIAEGDTVVASASFLVDSESRLRAAMEGMTAPGAARPAMPGMPGMAHPNGGMP